MMFRAWALGSGSDRFKSKHCDMMVENFIPTWLNHSFMIDDSY